MHSKRLIACVFTLVIFIPVLVYLPCWVKHLPELEKLGGGGSLKRLYWAIDYQMGILEEPEPTWYSKLNAIHAGVDAFQKTEFNSVKNLLSDRPIEMPLIDLYGLVVSITDRKRIPDANYNIVRMDHGALTLIVEKMDDGREKAYRVAAFRDYLQRRNIKFLFVLAPHKVCKYEPRLPRNIVDFSNEMGDGFLQYLREKGVDYVDAREIFKTNPEKHYELFYKTDTHWNAEYAFHAFVQAADFLHSRHPMDFPPQVLDANNYRKIIAAENIPGDLAKRLGRWYLSPEPLAWYVPRFPTKLDCRISGKERYSGEFHPQFFADAMSRTVRNENVASGKVFIVSDSFGPPFAGFMSLAFRDLRQIGLHACFAAHRIPNIHQEIEDFKPDMVVLLLTSRDFVGAYFELLSP